MSWFDSSGFSSIARSALKEAQRTIDKALDIKEDFPTDETTSAVLKEGSDNFFAEFGLGSKKTKKEESPDDASKTSVDAANNLASSIWGSFTGSLIEKTSESPTTPLAPAANVVAVQPVKSLKKSESPDIEELKTDISPSKKPVAFANTENTETISSSPSSKDNPKEGFNSIFSPDSPRSVNDHTNQANIHAQCSDANFNSDTEESQASSLFTSSTCSKTEELSSRLSNTSDSRTSTEADTRMENVCLSKPTGEATLSQTSGSVPQEIGQEEVDWGWESGIAETTLDEIIDQSDPVSQDADNIETDTGQPKENQTSHIYLDTQTVQSDQIDNSSKLTNTISSDNSSLGKLDLDYLPSSTQSNENRVIPSTLPLQTTDIPANDNSRDAPDSRKTSIHDMANSSSDEKSVSSPSDASHSVSKTVSSYSSSSDSFAVISSGTSSSIDTIEDFHSPKSPTSPLTEEDSSSSKSGDCKISPGSMPLTVQPSKSPLKISNPETARRDAGSRWGSGSGASDSDDTDSNSVAETSVESLPDTITTQPVAESAAITWDSQKWDSCSEDMSASESVRSSSSVITLIEGGAPPSVVDCQATSIGSSDGHGLGLSFDSKLSDCLSQLDNETISTAPSTIDDTNSQERTSLESNQTTIHSSSSTFQCYSETDAMNLASPRDTSKLKSVDDTSSTSTTGSTLPSSIPLDVSVESGGSSDTITASMDSSALMGMSVDDGEWSTLGDETPLPNILSETKDESKISEGESAKDLPEKDSIVHESGGSRGKTADGATAQLDPSEAKKAKGLSEEDNSDGRCSSASLLPDADRDHSPSSSDSLTSEMVKVGGSEHTSGHTSGDEFETTTSSDIEVISSPSLDGISVYGGSYNMGGAGGGALLGPAHHTASRVWHSAKRLKSYLVEPNNGNGGSSRGSNGGSFADAAISPSMTASFTSISESEGEMWGLVGEATSPPRTRPKKDTSTHIFERGHTRNESNMSETSESSSEPLTPEADKLAKRINELNEVLEARESRLFELSQHNVSLQEQTNTLQSRVQELEVGGSCGGDGMESLREEFTQRLATMEKKFQQALREKESLTKQVETLRMDSATRLSSTEVKLQLEERDTIIAELRHEGEKLSKQQLTYSTTIKKLRSKEKELEATNASQNAKIDTQRTEIDRQHKQLLAKCEVERRQVSAVTQLTGQLQQAQEQLKTISAESAETEGKMVVLKEALDAAYRELGDAKRQESARAAQLAEHTLSAEVGAKQQLQEALHQQQKMSGREKQTLILQLEEAQEEKGLVQQMADRTERMLRNELSTLQQQLSDSEGRGEQLSAAVAAATRPLLRQIENLQNTHTSHRTAWEELELQLSHRLQEAEKSAKLSSDRERNVREQSSQALTQKAALQAQVDTLKSENVALAAKLQNLSSTLSRLEEEKASSDAESNTARASLTRELSALKAECDNLKSQIIVEQTALESEKKRNDTLQIHITDLEAKKRSSGSGGNGGGGFSRQSSPTPSLSRLSVSGSVQSFMAGPYHDDVFESAGWQGTRQHASLYEALRGNTATTVEALTSQLSQREGELHLLQTEVSRHEAQKESLGAELLQLTQQVQQLQQQMEQHNVLQQQHDDVSQKYNALLQMYGEKVEEVEELRLDLEDVKDMYKAQINQLMQQ